MHLVLALKRLLPEVLNSHIKTQCLLVENTARSTGSIHGEIDSYTVTDDAKF
jgi:hypothetical protein